MDLLSRAKIRERQREMERLKKLQEEEIFKKPEKAYVPSFKRLTVVFFFLCIIAVAAIMLNSEVVARNECSLMPGVDCRLASLTQTQLTLEVSNYLKENLNITLKIEGCGEGQSNEIRPNLGAAYTFNCELNEKIVDRKIEMTYVGYSRLPHTKEGWLRGKPAE